MTPCHDLRLGVTKINGDFLNGFKGPFGNSIIIPAFSGLAFLFRSQTDSPTPRKTGRHHYDSTPSAAVPGRAFTGAPAEGGFFNPEDLVDRGFAFQDESHCPGSAIPLRCN
jgi:hypothetical protein